MLPYQVVLPYQTAENIVICQCSVVVWYMEFHDLAAIYQSETITPSPGLGGKTLEGHRNGNICYASATEP